MPGPRSVHHLFEAGVFGCPSQYLTRTVGARDQDGRVSGTARVFIYRHSAATYPAYRVDDFPDRTSKPRAEIPLCSLAPLEQVPESANVCVSKIRDVNAVTNCSSVMSHIIGTKDLRVWSYSKTTPYGTAGSSDPAVDSEGIRRRVFAGLM